MGELNKFENDFSKISDQLTNNTKIILGITLDDGEKIYNSFTNKISRILIISMP